MLVGRDTELRDVARLVAQVRLGRGAALAVVGAPGVGKTSLVQQVVSTLGPDVRVLRAVGSETERDLAFAGLDQLLRPALGLLGEVPAPQAEALAGALALRAGRPGDRFAVGAATLSLLTRFAEAGPVAVVVDDVHLVDVPTVEALVFAARRLGDDPVVLLLAARAPEIGRQLADLPTLELAALAREPARVLVEQAAGAPFTEEVFEDLYRRAAGNPLALQELARSPAALQEAPPGLPATLPAVVADAFARRVRGLGAEAGRVLLVAAVSGGDVALTARACARLRLDVARLAEAEDAGLVAVGEERVRFRHPLLREATYSVAGAGERRAAHRAVADVLPEGEVERRAWHRAEAAWGLDAEAADLLRRAGDLAIARSGYAAAATAYHRAAALSAEPAERADGLLRAAGAAWSAGQTARVGHLLDELGHAGPGPAPLPALELRAAVAASTGSLRTALDLYLAAADSTTSPDDQAVLLADAVHATFYLADTSVALGLADRLRDLAPSLRTDRSRALGLMAEGVAGVLAGRGGADEIRAAVPLLESGVGDDPHRWQWLMLAPLFLRDAHHGARLREEVGRMRGSAGVGALPALLFHVARDQATTTWWSSATANYAEAIRLARETGQTTELAICLAGLAWLRSRQGDADGCREAAAEASALCATRDLHLGEAWVLFAVGDLELSLGDVTAAVARLRTLEDVLAGHGMGDPDLSPCPELVDALLRVGDADGARALAAPYVAAADGKGQPWARARARRVLGLLAPDEELDGEFGAALELHDLTLDVFETARTRLAYGARLRRAGRRVDARVQLREALATFEQLGAARWAEHAAAELTATGEHVRRAEAGWRPALTPQELQVGLLLAQGRTTRETAAVLFLSPKTVEYHLRKVYAKLDIHSREELADVLREEHEGGGESVSTSR